MISKLTLLQNHMGHRIKCAGFSTKCKINTKYNAINPDYTAIICIDCGVQLYKEFIKYE